VSTSAKLPPAPPRSAARPIASFTIEELKATGISGAAAINALAAEPVPWLWRPFVVSGTIVLLAGSSFGGKTTLLFLLVLARAGAVDVDFLGHPLQAAPPGQYVIFIEGEQSEKAAARKCARCARILQRHLPGFVIPDRLIILAREQIKVGTMPWKRITTLVEQGLVSDIILDTIAATTNEKANDEQSQAGLFQKFVKVIRSSPPTRPTTLWVAAHIRKPGNQRGTGLPPSDITIHEVGGSVQRVAQSDSVLMVESFTKDGRVTHAKVSFSKLKEDPPDDEDVRPITYKATPKDGLVVVKKATPAPTGGRSKAVDKLSVLAFFASTKGEHSSNQVVAAIGGGRLEIRAYIDELIAEKQLAMRVGELMGNKTKLYRKV
jgi:hypothetical protein